MYFSIGGFDVPRNLRDTRLALLRLNFSAYVLRIGTIICLSKQESVIKCTFPVSTRISFEIG